MVFSYISGFSVEDDVQDLVSSFVEAILLFFGFCSTGGVPAHYGQWSNDFLTALFSVWGKTAVLRFRHCHSPPCLTLSVTFCQGLHVGCYP